MRDLRVRWHIRRERNNSQSPMEGRGLCGDTWTLAQPT